MKIIGAGLAGLLAANMLSHRRPEVLEAQSELPNNHSAVLRFRSPIVGDVLNIPFKKVTMIKTNAPWRNPVADALAYSFKNGGVIRSDRSIIAGTTVADRWIAPLNLIARMSERCDIKFGHKLEQFGEGTGEPWVSTIPMPSLMKLLNYPGAEAIEFKSRPGITLKARIKNCDAYVSVLVPDLETIISRISITGDELIVEIPGEHQPSDFNSSLIAQLFETIFLILGFHYGDVELTDVEVKHQRYAKIMPIDDAQRKNFMHWATDNFNIFSLGRFATWRPGLLLDDLVQDVRKIDRWMNDGKYAIAMER